MRDDTDHVLAALDLLASGRYPFADLPPGPYNRANVTLETDPIARYLEYLDLPRITEQKIEIPKATRMMCIDPRRAYGPHYAPAARVLLVPPEALPSSEAEQSR